MSFNGKEITLINFLITFYRNKIELFSDIINQKTPLSLRLLDWLVTNYAKKYNIIYPLQSNNETVYFNIYIDYKNQLKAYSKKFFDPFCRQKRLVIDPHTFKWRTYISEEDLTKKDIVTTVGQLNFFRWFIENKVIDYALYNVELIDADMMTTINSKKKGKRCVLSPNAMKGIYTNKCDITIKFKP
tara:strand:+ start:14717 stop:15274 length:558 start_codon:yes stop_codon:yes gene_type:complete